MSQDHNLESIAARVRENWGWFVALGAILVLGGLVIIAAPLAASIAVTLLIAAVLVIGGAIQIYQSFKVQGWAGFLWSLITGIIALAGGIIIYTNPLAGTLALTLVVAAVFVAQGLSQIVFALRLRPHSGWIWVLIAGVVSLAAGGMIWAELPDSADWALGLMAGISILFNGWSYIAIGLAARATAD
ncbi:MAG: HdeD family acid-resistance protein [Pannonibacter sp.]